MIEHNNFHELLQTELFELTKLRQKLQEALSDAPKGSLHVLPRKGKQPEYYLYESRKKRTYISRKETSIAARLAQKEYDRHLLEIVEKRIKAGKGLAEQYKSPLQSVYDDINSAKKTLAVPYEMSDEEYAEKTNEKINQYMINGYMPGMNFLFSMESRTEPLNVKIVEKIVDTHLL